MNRQETNRKPGDSDVHRHQRGKNRAMLVALLGLILLIYIVAIVRMGGS